MALNLLGTEGSAVKHFDVRLDQDVILLRGNENEAGSALLRGVVVLCLCKPLNVKRLQLELTGAVRISWTEPNDSHFSRRKDRGVKEKRVFYRHRWTFVDMARLKNNVLEAGNYEYPFEHIIDGDWSESVEGLSNAWVVYRMKASIERGALARNISTESKHLRVVRTLDQLALELSHAMVVENTWLHKLDYCLSIPQKAFIFGTSIPVDIKLIPLLKGLKLGKMEISLIETLELSVPFNRQKTQETIVSAEFEPECELEMLNEQGQDGWHITRSLALPKSLRSCRQNVTTRGIRIRHRLSFNIQLLNPDGHISELRAVLPVLVFISPNLMLDENLEVTNSGPATAQALREMAHNAPPNYGEHHFDQLWNEVDVNGFATPAESLSGFTTPSNGRSRQGSADDSTTPLPLSSIPLHLPHMPVTPNALHQRLESFNMTSALRGRNEEPTLLTRSRSQSRVTRQSGSPTRSANPLYPQFGHSFSCPRLSRRGSQESSGSQSSSASSERIAPHADFDSAELAQVPSYRTAVKTRARTPVSSDLPTYAWATTSIPSPVPE